MGEGWGEGDARKRGFAGGTPALPEMPSLDNALGAEYAQTRESARLGVCEVLCPLAARVRVFARSL